MVSWLSIKTPKYLQEETTFINLSSNIGFKFRFLFVFDGGIIKHAVLFNFKVISLASNQTFKLRIFALISFCKVFALYSYITKHVSSA